MCQKHRQPSRKHLPLAMSHRLVSIFSSLQLLQYNYLAADLYVIAERENSINLLSTTRSEELNQTYDIHIHHSRLYCLPLLSSRGHRKLPNIVKALMDKEICHTRASTRDSIPSCQLSAWSRAVTMCSSVLVYTVPSEYNLQMAKRFCFRLKVKHSFSRWVFSLLFTANNFGAAISAIYYFIRLIWTAFE